MNGNEVSLRQDGLALGIFLVLCLFALSCFGFLLLTVMQPNMAKLRTEYHPFWFWIIGSSFYFFSEGVS